MTESKVEMSRVKPVAVTGGKVGTKPEESGAKRRMGMRLSHSRPKGCEVTSPAGRGMSEGVQGDG